MSALHAGITPIQRENSVKDFINRKTRILIATDLVARGLDFPEVKSLSESRLKLLSTTIVQKIF